MKRRDVVREASAEDCASIAAIYNEGIAEGRSTFETETRSATDIDGWLGSPIHPVLVAESTGLVAGWARIAPYSPRACYAHIAEASVYVRASMRGRGLGGALASALLERTEQAGLEKVIGKLFADNEASRRLTARYGFREVGLHLRHGRVCGEWRDVLVVELLLEIGVLGIDTDDPVIVHAMPARPPSIPTPPMTGAKIMHTDDTPPAVASGSGTNSIRSGPRLA